MGSMPDLGHALSLAALVAGALEYAILVRHRQQQRWDRQSDDLIRTTGLQALVRVTLIDEQMTRSLPARRSRFRSHRFGRGPLLHRQVHLPLRTKPAWLSRLSSR